jgi:hypothetical protein
MVWTVKGLELCLVGSRVCLRSEASTVESLSLTANKYCCHENVHLCIHYPVHLYSIVFN